VALSFTRLAAKLLLEVDVARFKFTAVYDPVKRGETDRQHIVLHDVERRLTFLYERRNDFVDVDQFSESQIESTAAVFEQREILSVSIAGEVQLPVSRAWHRFSVQVFAAITHMRRDLKLVAFPHFVFVAPLIAGRSASVAA